jgi:simple sugar transport system ATP-binding protein
MEILSGMRLPSRATGFLGKPLPFAGRSDADGLPRTFRELGIAHVPEDRLRDGVIKAFSVMHNTIFGYQDNLKTAGACSTSRPSPPLRGADEELRRAPE